MEQKTSEIELYVQQMQQHLENLELQKQQLQSQHAQTMFGQENSDNLVKWQLDIKEELNRIEHLLRKHIPMIDENGNEYYSKPEESEQLFNEKGINEVLNLLAWYLNKNIILSNFSEKQIDLRMQQLGDTLTDFIYNNYEDFGLDTKDKIKHFPVVVLNIVNTIEAAYNRALNGGERDSLRTARHVTQSEPIGNYGGMQGYGMSPQSKKFSFFKPTTWGR